MQQQQATKTILLVGGGSGGPVAPLVAVSRTLRKTHGKDHFRFVLVGTKNGPERMMAKHGHLAFEVLPVAKLRRYFSISNLFLPITFIWALVKSFLLIRKRRPSLIFGAGSFLQVPVVIAAKFFGIPIVIHQQDVKVSLSNQLCALFAKKITVTFLRSTLDFPESFMLSGLKGRSKVVHTGNPCMLSDEEIDMDKAKKHFGFSKHDPLVFILGGGTGAKGLNDIVEESLPELLRVTQVLHSTGKGKLGDLEEKENVRYRPVEFVTDMPEAYAAADIVVARAGLSTITELSHLGKVSIIIPMPKSHQEQNAMLLMRKKAAVVIPQDYLDAEAFVLLIRKLLVNGKTQKQLAINMHGIMPRDASEKIADILYEIIYAKSKHITKA